VVSAAHYSYGGYAFCRNTVARCTALPDRIAGGGRDGFRHVVEDQVDAPHLLTLDSRASQLIEQLVGEQLAARRRRALLQ
jgi:hypothetical protein